MTGVTSTQSGQGTGSAVEWPPPGIPHPPDSQHTQLNQAERSGLPRGAQEQSFDHEEFAIEGPHLSKCSIGEEQDVSSNNIYRETKVTETDVCWWVTIQCSSNGHINCCVEIGSEIGANKWVPFSTVATHTHILLLCLPKYGCIAYCLVLCGIQCYQCTLGTYQQTSCSIVGVSRLAECFTAYIILYTSKTYLPQDCSTTMPSLAITTFPLPVMSRNNVKAFGVLGNLG